MRKFRITGLMLIAILAALVVIWVGCGGGGGGGCVADVVGGGGGGDVNDNAPQPVVDSVTLGLPICSVDGPGAVDGPTFTGNTGLIDVSVCPVHPSAYMRVWLQANTSGAEIAYYDWQILGWQNAVPHGTLAYYDEVVDIDLDEGRYIVRTYGANRIRYDSSPNQNLTADFSETVNAIAWTAEGKFVNAFFQVNLHPEGGGGDDHGNTPGSATPIPTLGTPVNGSINPGGDVDFFSFAAVGGRNYSISTGGTTDTVLQLVARNGIDVLATDDDGGPGFLSLIQWACPASGTYYARVSHYSAAGTGAYTLTVEEQTAPPTGATLLVQNGFRPHLSPNGSRLVFTRLSSTASDAQSDIWLINTDGSGLTRLTNTSAMSEYSPQWTLDGQSIAFLRKEGPYVSNTLGTLWEIHPDGSGEQQRFSYAMIQSFCFYVYSAGPHVILEYPGDNDGIWLSMSAWPEVATLAQRRASGGDPRGQANPSGESANIVLFDAGLLGARGAIVFNPINLEERIIDNGGRFPWPCLSPNGTKIVAGADGGLPVGLYLMNLDGSGPSQLTTSVDHQPTWSNDVLVFVRIGSGGSLNYGDLYLIRGVNE
jgi:hypothetical protein